MDPRLKIPVFGLLGLGLTACDRQGEATIVGEWKAVELDGQAYPNVEQYSGDSLRRGWQLDIGPELDGSISFYTIYDYDDVGARSDLSERLMVDDGAAPNHKISFNGEALQLMFGYAGYDDGGDGDYVLHDELERAGAARPIVAGGTSLDCELADDTLDCTLTTDRELDRAPKRWRFARSTEET